MTPARRTLTVREIADQLGVGRDSVYELLRRGEIPSIRVRATGIGGKRPGSPYIVTRHAFEEWLQRCGTRREVVQ